MWCWSKPQRADSPTVNRAKYNYNQCYPSQSKSVLWLTRCESHCQSVLSQSTEPGRSDLHAVKRAKHDVSAIHAKVSQGDQTYCLSTEPAQHNQYYSPQTPRASQGDQTHPLLQKPCTTTVNVIHKPERLDSHPGSRGKHNNSQCYPFQSKSERSDSPPVNRAKHNASEVITIHLRASQEDQTHPLSIERSTTTVSTIHPRASKKDQTHILSIEPLVSAIHPRASQGDQDSPTVNKAKHDNSQCHPFQSKPERLDLPPVNRAKYNNSQYSLSHSKPERSDSHAANRAKYDNSQCYPSKSKPERSDLPTVTKHNNI